MSNAAILFQEEQSKELVSFVESLDRLLKGNPPISDQAFADLMNQTMLDGDVCNLILFHQGIKRSWRIFRSADGQFCPVSIGRHVRTQGQVDVDVDGDDLNVVVRTMNQPSFTRLYYIRWWAIIDAQYEMGRVSFERKVFDSVESHIARIEHGSQRPMLIAIIEQ